MNIPLGAVTALAKARKVLVITGAGASADSGVPTFRGAGGLWRIFNVEEVATPEGFARDPKRAWKWYDERREEIAKVRPNPAHEALARLEEKRDCLIATQNVDRLHHKAGSRNVVEIHGCIWEVRCTREGKTWLDERVPLPEIPPRCECGALLRPGVVWYGELVPVECFEEVNRFVRGTPVGLVLVIGTTAQFPYIQDWILRVKHGGAVVVDANLEPGVAFADYGIPGRAGETIPEYLRLAGV